VTAVEPTFVLCIEQNEICEQALLLCESIRAFAGRHRAAPILAVSPRPGLGVDRRTRRRLETMSVEYVDEPLNVTCPEYGSANRVYTAAWAERRARTEWIVVLDSDTVFLGEPQLPADADVAVRPVDAKGSATEGPGDRFEDYWERLAGMHGVPLDRLPFVHTLSGHRVRASYNGGLIVVRPALGILSAWADLFSRSVAAGLRPWRGSGLNVFASTGLVGPEASEYWGSNQAAAALAIWSATSRVCMYPDAYNVPLHLLMDNQPRRWSEPRESPAPASPAVHVHYHWLFGDPYYRPALRTLRRLGVGRDRLDWLAERLPISRGARHPFHTRFGPFRTLRQPASLIRSTILDLKSR